MDAVLAAAGHRVLTRRRTWPAGLSAREVEVLRLVARGQSDRQMAAALSLSPRTVHHHVQHIYERHPALVAAAEHLAIPLAARSRKRR